MNIASLELCKELYELSGWKKNGDTIPIYNLTYLLDKLTEVKTGLTLYHVHSTMQWECFYAGKFFDYEYFEKTDESYHWKLQASTPEDAAAKLAIELFKQGILRKS